MTQNEYIEVDVLRLGRNYVRVGDTVRVLPSKRYARDGFRSARVTALFLHRSVADPDPAFAEGVDVSECESWCAQVRVRDPRTGAGRTFFLDRVQRRSQTKARA